MVTTRFDVIVMVDWSASAVPTSGRDSVWIASVDVRGGHPTLANPATRAEAIGELQRLLVAAAGRRVLVGIDLPLGYPAGFAAALQGGPDRGIEPAWRALWRHLADAIHDDGRNRNNRFEVASDLNERLGPGPGPFWGCPTGAVTEHLRATKAHRFPYDAPTGPLEEFRLVERILRTGDRRPSSVWQTAYAGSVGGQALVGIPALVRVLADDAIAPRARIWPFDTGLDPDPTGGARDAVVVAEVWPSAFDLDLGRHEVRDAAQVLGVCEHLARLDTEDALAPWFAPDVDPSVIRSVVAEEGWILGVTAPVRNDRGPVDAASDLRS